MGDAWLKALNLALLVIGLLLGWLALRATLYLRSLRNAERAVVGDPWLLSLLYHYMAINAIGLALLVVVRGLTIVYGSTDWLRVLGGIVVTGLLLLPLWAVRVIRSHEQ